MLPENLPNNLSTIRQSVILGHEFRAGALAGSSLPELGRLGQLRVARCRVLLRANRGASEHGLRVTSTFFSSGVVLFAYLLDGITNCGFHSIPITDVPKLGLLLQTPPTSLP